jgi:DNA adenine methylase
MKHANRGAARQRIEAVSIAQYAGRKQWFLPHAFRYFQSHPCQTLIEPFAGSGVVGLSLLHAGVIERLVLVEKDERLVCMHEGILNDPTLIDRYAAFECTKESVRHLFRTERTAFRYLVQTRCCNRAKFDGGLRSNLSERLCKEMVIRNILRVQAMRDRITVIYGDGLEVIRQHLGDPSVGCFADPAYTSEQKGGGHRLYRHRFAGRQNHHRLFSLLSRWRDAWLLTEDNCRTVRRLARAYRFSFKRVHMNGSENKRRTELMIWRKLRIL